MPGHQTPRFSRPRPAAPARADRAGTAGNSALARAAAHPVTRRLALPGAVLLALAAVFGLATGTRPGPAPAASPDAQTTAVTSVTRACPPGAPGSPQARVAVLSVPAAAGPAARSAGVATFSTVGAESASGGKPAGPAKPRTVSRPGTVTTVTSPGGGATALTATGDMAQGFAAEQTDASGTGLVSCSHPGSDLWFAGAGQATGAAHVWLYLMNPGTVPASVNVTLLTDTGEQDGLNSAIAVAPGQYVKKDIAPLVRGSQALALHVQAGAGQVSAAVRESGTKGAGAWLPQAAAPSRTLVIPGLTVASSAARLFVVVPGAADAQLKVVAYTPSGAVTQFPGAPVDASAGAATPVALSSLGASAAGLKVTSNVPVVAAVLVPGTGLGSFTTATAPLTEQGVVAGNPAAKGVTVGLLLTAPAAAAQFSVSLISADGTVTQPADGRSVTVTGGRTLALTVARPPGTREPFAVVVTPAAGSGPVYAVRVVTAGAGGLSAPAQSLLPVPSALTAVTLPSSHDTYQAVLPG